MAHYRKKLDAETFSKQFAVQIRLSAATGRTFLRMTIPSELDLNGSYLALIETVDAIRKARNSRMRIYFDFSRLKRIDEGAALILAAEIDATDRMNQSKLRRRKDRRWKPEIEQTLLQFGFFDLLRVYNPPRPCAVVDAKRYVRYITGNHAAGALADRLRESLASQASEDDRPALLAPVDAPQARREFYEAIIEAMGNVSNHAYVPDCEYAGTDVFGRWWMGGAYDPVNKEFTAVFYDKGRGIPSSLEAREPNEYIRKWMSRINASDYEGFMIQAAMSLGRSRTGSRHRGKGLPQMRRMIADDRPGQMTIISGKGRYDYIRPTRKGRNKGIYYDTVASLSGTFLLWKVRISD